MYRDVVCKANCLSKLIVLVGPLLRKNFDSGVLGPCIVVVIVNLLSLFYYFLEVCVSR